MTGRPRNIVVVLGLLLMFLVERWILLVGGAVSFLKDCAMRENMRLLLWRVDTVMLPQLVISQTESTISTLCIRVSWPYFGMLVSRAVLVVPNCIVVVDRASTNRV